jgi:glucose/arabinose dehydrogenase
MRRSYNLFLLMAGIAISLGLNPSSPAFAYNTIRVASGLDQPCFAASPLGDKDRLFIVEQKTARIKVLYRGILQTTPFLDLGNIVSGNHDEQGLLGLAFHPNFLTNGFFYVSYTTADNAFHVVRYHASPNSNVTNINNPNNPQPILDLARCVPTDNGGALAFGPDGYLYIATGDGDYVNDPENNAQNGQTLLGKILRLDVNSTPPYTIPQDNPFINNPDIRSEVWALGLHNPSSISFDQLTGSMYLTDVGQDNFEEVDFQPAAAGGQNYGWTVYEGTYFTQRGELSRGASVVTYPTYEYPHNNMPAWIIGGSVYRGTVLPELQGTYFFADKFSGQIYSMKYDASQQAVLNRTADFTPTQQHIINQPACIAPNASGEFFIVDRFDGEIYKVVAGVPLMTLQLTPKSPTSTPPLNPQIDVFNAPNPPPILIPAEGGTIVFSANVANNETAAQQNYAVFDFWTDLVLPNQTVISPFLQYFENKLRPGESLDWGLQTLEIPGNYPAGNYLLEGHIGHFPEEPWFTTQIPFSKLVSTNPQVGSTSINGFANGVTSGNAEILPARIELMNAYPNPFNPETVLRFVLPEAAHVNLTVFDISGRQVATLVNGMQEAGVHQVAFQGSSLPSGVYIYRFQSGDFTTVNKMTLIK